MKRTVFFRADSSNVIGLGHIVRCLALAQMLDADFQIIFVCKEVSIDIIKDIESLFYQVILIESEEQFLSELAPNNIVVLDHYGLDSTYQKAIKKKGCKLVCIDDLHNKEFFADLIINHGPGFKPEHYKAQHYTQFALGLDYVLLRPLFLEKVKQPGTKKLIENVFVCFGGSDFKNLTQRVVNILKQDLRFTNIVVVVGSEYGYLNELKEISESDERFQIYHAIDSEMMTNLISSSGLAIVPSSGILLEALALDCKVISGMYVDNQRNIFNNYRSIKAFISAEDFSDHHILAALTSVFFETLNSTSSIDGKSDLRILKLFKNLLLEEEIFLRKALTSDVLITYNWALDKSVRAYAFNQSSIDFQGHNDWFLSKINDDECYYYIAEWKGQTIGSVRFDLNEQEIVISYLIDPGYHKNGLGLSILKKGITNFYTENKGGFEKIVGYVHKHNIASNKIFDKLYFTREEEEMRFKYILLSE